MTSPQFCWGSKLESGRFWQSDLVGFNVFETNSFHATLWNGSTATDLGTLGGSTSSAYAINTSGQIVGISDITGDGASHATLWNGTTPTDLGTLGGKNSSASAINASGQIVGDSDISGDSASHAALWNGTAATDLGTLGGRNSFANAINTSGQIVGYSGITGNTATHATLWDGATVTDLNSFLDGNTSSAGWVLTNASGISDNGSIVGSASNSVLGITNHTFLLAPIPEPDTYAMLLAGLGLMGFMTRQKRRS